ncbi:MAG: hypothetical protein NUV78_01665 [Candidatus Zambryskibacteria bacterium]|nr:hypothetical protein [Candidatus Zambryskibacteria bacterium]
MKFRYKKFGNVLRPVIPIKVSSSSNTDGFGYEVRVDSGADLCIFHAEIGEALGINVKKGKPQEVFGIGGKASIYYLHKVNIVVGGWPYEIEAGFMPSVAGNVMQYGVVGQRGFFDLFTIKFDLSKSEIELKELK